MKCLLCKQKLEAEMRFDKKTFAVDCLDCELYCDYDANEKCIDMSHDMFDNKDLTIEQKIRILKMKAFL